MSYRNRFLTGLAAAAITFASLMAFVGPKRFADYKKHRPGYERHCGEKEQIREEMKRSE
ncbi:MAG: hypothetical protein J0I84_03315 [Terrimonas sp.]|uniref:hypothetical protein n=1 Tax=Terrimonas sp. TaxID=1914338 RepID=UPI000ACAF144|nr:hypothetical protein [Terrimonas sp.]MBN8786090.1 hypothetical protein [Terrimonas sp.]